MREACVYVNALCLCTVADMYALNVLCIRVIVYALFCNTSIACWQMLSIDERTYIVEPSVNTTGAFASCFASCLIPGP